MTLVTAATQSRIASAAAPAAAPADAADEVEMVEPAKFSKKLFNSNILSIKLKALKEMKYFIDRTSDLFDQS